MRRFIEPSPHENAKERVLVADSGHSGLHFVGTENVRVANRGAGHKNQPEKHRVPHSRLQLKIFPIFEARQFGGEWRSARDGSETAHRSCALVSTDSVLRS